LGNRFLETWHDNEDQLSAALPEAVETFEKAVAAEDFDAVAILVGEAIGLIRDIRTAADIVRDMARDAARILGRA
jgi:nitronate monooxygenase